MDRGAWRAMVHRVAKSDTTEATSHTRMCVCVLWVELGLPKGWVNVLTVPQNVTSFRDRVFADVIKSR